MAEPGCPIPPTNPGMDAQEREYMRLSDLPESAYFDPEELEVDRLVSRQAATVSSIQELRPVGVAELRADQLLDERDVYAMRPVMLSEVTARRVRGYDPAEVGEHPIHVWFGNVRSLEDLENVEAGVSNLRAVEVERPEVPAEGIQTSREIDEAQGKIDRLRALIQQAVNDNDWEGAKEVRAALDGAWRELQAARDVKRGQERSAQAWSVGVDDARAMLHRLTGVEGYGMRTGELTGSALGAPRALGGHRLKLERTTFDEDGKAVIQSVSPVAVVHTLDAMASTIQRMARTAVGPMGTGRHRADTARALHMLDAYIMHLYGRDQDAMRAISSARLSTRMKLDMEVKDLQGKEAQPEIRRTRGTKTPDPEEPLMPAEDGGLGDAVRRTLRDNDLIARSGGSLRLAAHLESLARADETEVLLAVAGRWADDAHRGLLARRGHRSTEVHTAVSRYVAGLLSGIDTVARNTVGTLVFGAYRGGPERFVERIATEGLRRGVDMATRETGAASAAAVKATWEGLQLAVRLWQANYLDPRGQRSIRAREAIAANRGSGQHLMQQEFLRSMKTDMDERQAVHGLPQSIMDATDGTWLQPYAQGLSLLGEVAGGLGQMGTFTSDVVAQTIGYRAHLAAAVQRRAFEAREAGRHMGPEEMKALAREMEGDAEVRAAALDSARSNSFLKIAEDTPTTMLLEMKKRNPAVGWLVPFVNTISNIAKEKIQRLPWGEKYGLGLTKAVRERAQKDENFRKGLRARQMLAGTLIGSGFLLRDSDLITGWEAGRPDKRHAGFDANWKPWSLKVKTDEGTAYVPLLFLDPVLFFPMVGAALYEGFQSVGTATEDAGRLNEMSRVMDTVAAIGGELMFSAHWAGNLENGMRVLGPLLAGDGEGAARALERMESRLVDTAAGTVLPSSALLKDIRRVQADLGTTLTEQSGDMGRGTEAFEEHLSELGKTTLKEIASLSGGVLGKAPEGVYTKRAIWDGEPIKSFVPQAPRESWLGPTVSAMASPAALAYQYETKAAKAAMLLGWNPKVPTRHRRVDVLRKVPPESIEMTPAEYDRFMELLGKRFHKLTESQIDTKWYSDPRTTDEVRLRKLGGWYRSAERWAWQKLQVEAEFRDSLRDRIEKARSIGEQKYLMRLEQPPLNERMGG